MANSTAAEQALRALLKNMRNETRANHAEALANFKAAVRAYNKAQTNAVRVVNKALANPTAQNMKRATEALGITNAMAAAAAAAPLKRRNALFAVASEPLGNKVPIGKNNFKVTRNETGKIVNLAGRKGKYHQFGSQNGKNYVRLENGSWYQLGNVSGQKYNMNKSGKFVKKQGLLGRVGGAVGGALAGGVRATGGALGRLTGRKTVKPNNPESTK